MWYITTPIDDFILQSGLHGRSQEIRLFEHSNSNTDTASETAMHRSNQDSFSTLVEFYASRCIQMVVVRAESGVPASRRGVLASMSGVTLGLGVSFPPTVQAAPPSEVRRVPMTHISQDLEISKVIKGCWQLSGGHRGEGRSDRTFGHAAVEDIHTFVHNGITTLDTADIYGPSEKIIGSYRREFPSEGRQCQILTKFCCFGNAMQRAGDPDFVSASLNRSRENIGVDRLDCVQFFWADYGVKQYVSAALSLAELEARGVTKTVGVTNFDVQRLDEIVKAGVRVATNQIQYSLLDTRPENGMAEFCVSNGIAMLPYGTVAGGFLSDRYLGKPAEKCVHAAIAVGNHLCISLE